MLVIIDQGLIDTDEILFTLPKTDTREKIKVTFKNGQAIVLAASITNEEFVMMMKHIHNLTDKTATIVDLDIFLRQSRKAASARRKAKEAEENADFHPPTIVGSDKVDGVTINEGKDWRDEIDYLEKQIGKFEKSINYRAKTHKMNKVWS